jgi:hypothetical protein
VSPSNEKLKDIFAWKPYFYFTFHKNIILGVVTCFFKIWHQTSYWNPKVSGAGVTAASTYIGSGFLLLRIVGNSNGSVRATFVSIMLVLSVFKICQFKFEMRRMQHGDSLALILTF